MGPVPSSLSWDAAACGASVISMAARSEWRRARTPDTQSAPAMPPHSREIAAMRSSRRNRRVGEQSPNSGWRPECSMRLPSERARQEPSSRPTVPSPEGKRHFLVRGSTSAQKISARESRNSEELDGSSHGGNSRVRWSGRVVRPQARTAWVHREEVTSTSIAPMPRWLLVS